MLFVGLFTLPLQAARLLVNIDRKASFTPVEFAEAASAKLLNIDPRNPYKAFHNEAQDAPFAVLSHFLNDSQLRQLSCKHGYRYLTLKKESLDQAVEQTYNLSNSGPKISSEIPYLSLEESAAIYRLMKKIDQVFTANKLRYWAGGGTLLGAVRHGGLIPWDDDLDLYILEVDEERLKRIESNLKKAGLLLHYYRKDLYKIFETDAKTIPDELNPQEISPFRYPSADIFLMTLEKHKEIDDVYVHRSYDFYWHWNNDRFDYRQIETIARVPFGPLTIPVPGDPEAYLDRLYGNQWKTYALEPSFNHKGGSHLPGASTVQIDDFSPAPWR